MIVVELGGPAASMSDLPERSGRVADAVVRQVTSLAKVLGIPGPITALVRPLDDARLDDARLDDARLDDAQSPSGWVRVRVNGLPCRYPDGLLGRIAALAGGQFLLTGELAAEWRTPGVPADRLADQIATLCVEAIKIRPSVLLDAAGLAQYAAGLAAGEPSVRADELDPAWLSAVLTAVLDLGIGIGDLQRVGPILEEVADDPAAEAAEVLIAALASDVFQWQLPADLAAGMRAADANQPDTLLATTVQELFDRTGIVPPRPMISDAADIPDGCFTVTINDLPSLPIRSLAADQWFVLAPAQVLDHVVPGVVGGLEPNLGVGGAVVGTDEAAALSAAGGVTCAAQAWLALHLDRVLAAGAGRYVHQDRILAQLDAIEDAYPVVVRAARAQLGPAALTRLIRRLATDGVSVTDLAEVLERVVDLPARDLGLDRYSVLGDRAAVNEPQAPRGSSAPHGDDEVEAFVRAGLRDLVTFGRGQSPSAIVAAVLDSALEDLACSPGRTVADDERVVVRIEHEYPRGNGPPVILTSDLARPAIRTLLAPWLPHVRVLAHSELPSAALVRPVARISLDD